MASYELRVGDTYPPIPVLLTDSSLSPAIDLSAATHVVWALKGVTASQITGYCAVQQVAITGTLSATTTVTAVSPTTGYVNGATINIAGATSANPGGIPVGATILSGAGTSTLTLSVAATTSGAFSGVINQGLVWIPLSGSNSVSTATGGAGFTAADTYTGETPILWSAGGLQTVPNAKNSDFTIVVDTAEY